MTNKKIFVGNLSFKTTQQQLTDTFSQFGELEDVRLITDYDTGQSKGFAFLSFKTEEAAKACLANGELDLDGRTLRLNAAQEKPKKNSQYSSNRRF